MRFILSMFLILLLIGAAVVLVPAGGIYYLTDSDRLLDTLAEREVYTTLERQAVEMVGIEDEAAAFFLNSVDMAAYLEAEAERVLPAYLAYLRGRSDAPEKFDLRPLKEHIRTQLSDQDTYMELMQRHDMEEYERLQELPEDARRDSINTMVNRHIEELAIPEEIVFADVIDTEAIGGSTAAYEALLRAVQLSGRWFEPLAIATAVAAVLLLFLLGGRAFWAFGFICLPIGLLYFALYFIMDRFVLAQLLRELQEDEMLRHLMDLPQLAVDWLGRIGTGYLGVALACLLLAFLFGRRRRETV